MKIPDEITRLEDAAERWADEQIIEGDFLCSCGKLCPLQDGLAIYNSPYAPPVCPECYDEIVTKPMIEADLDNPLNYKENS